MLARRVAPQAFSSGPTRAFRRQFRATVLMSLRAVEYEVHGVVQGVWFRAHTEDMARQLKLVGYVMNTSKGTVQGEVQGEESSIGQMKDWLATKGSPHSVIEKCDFTNEREVAELEYSSFTTKRR